LLLRALLLGGGSGALRLGLSERLTGSENLLDVLPHVLHVVPESHVALNEFLTT